MSDQTDPLDLAPCGDLQATFDSLSAQSADGAWPYSRKTLFFGVTPAMIDIEACGPPKPNPGQSESPNLPFKLVVYGKGSGMTPPPVLFEAVLQQGALPPHLKRVRVTGNHIEVHMIMAPGTVHYAYRLKPVPT